MDLPITTFKDLDMIKKNREGSEIYQEVSNSVFNFGVLHLILVSGPAVSSSY